MQLRLRLCSLFVILLAWHSSFAANGVRVKEKEPNNTAATAQALPGTAVVVRGSIVPGTDVDYYSFAANAGDRVYAAVVTAGSSAALGTNDSQLAIYGTDGTTPLEGDDNNGSLGALSSNIAGCVLPTKGIYYVRVSSNGTDQIRPYDLYLRVHSGTPVAEVEPNETPATANAMPAEGWINGTVVVNDFDYFAMNLNAGDTVCLILDLNPERDTQQANYRLSFGQFGGAAVLVDDLGETGANSEALCMTVQSAGTYYAIVDRNSGVNTYQLSATVFSQEALINPATYASSNVPLTIPTGPGTLTSQLTVPGHPRIGTLRVALNLDHARLADLDVSLISPSGNVVGLFHDISVAATTMDLVFDDAAAIPIGSFPVIQGAVFQPDPTFRLAWFNGQDAGGAWTLKINDDSAGMGGTLNSWSLTIGEPDPSLQQRPVIVYSTDFEANDGGFTHSGTNDTWQRGTPALNSFPIIGANSGTQCWKTNLTGVYSDLSNADLISPDISLAGQPGPIILNWAQKYQFEAADFDHAYVEVQEVGGANATRKVWEWQDYTMGFSEGNPQVVTAECAGWGLYGADISDFIGKTIRIRFHMDSDGSSSFVATSGWAIDDVTVSAVPPTPEIAIEQPAGTNLIDGTAAIDFGLVNPGSAASQKTFVIRNTGTGSLSGLAITLDGANFGDFSASALTASTLAPGASTTFTVTFVATGPGVRTAGLHITSNDGDESPFDVNLSGSQVFVTPAVLADAQLGVAYNQPFSASGGTPPYTFSAQTGTLPAGLTLSTSGVLSGTPTANGTFNFTVTATDSSTSGGPFTGSVAVTLNVVPSVSFLSGPAYSPTPVIVNIPATFTAATDPANAIVTWDFGDGTPSVSGASVTHLFAAAGDYNVAATAKNVLTNSTVSKLLTVPVIDVKVLPNTKPFTSLKGSIKIKSPADQLMLTAVFPAPTNQTAAGAVVKLNVGGLTRTITLDAKGKIKLTDGKAQMTISKSKKTGPAVKFAISLKGPLKASLATGAALDANGLPTKLLITLDLAGNVFSDIETLAFKKGSAKIVYPVK